MDTIIRAEYETPETTIYILSELSETCLSQGASITPFEEDDELVW